MAARLMAHDPRALTTAYEEYGKLVYGVASRVVCDRAMAEDVTQEVFTYLWTHPDRYDPSRNSLRGWVSLLAHRRSVDRVRAEQRRSSTESRLMGRPATDIDADADADDRLATQWVCERVRSALDSLPAEQREVLVGAYYGDRTYRQVAADLSLPEGTVKSRIRLALGRLNEILGTEFADEDAPAWT
jgi:RNA polymerase sigma factor (sigma-70 family)